MSVLGSTHSLATYDRAAMPDKRERGERTSLRLHWARRTVIGMLR
jgi:hypothetical protein